MDTELDMPTSRDVEMFRAARAEIVKRMELQQRTLATATGFAALFGTVTAALVARLGVSEFLIEKSVILLPLVCISLEFIALRQISHQANIFLLAEYSAGLFADEEGESATWEEFARSERTRGVNLFVSGAGSDPIVTLGLTSTILFVTLLTAFRTEGHAGDLQGWYDILTTIASIALGALIWIYSIQAKHFVWPLQNRSAIASLLARREESRATRLHGRWLGLISR